MLNFYLVSHVNYNPHSKILRIKRKKKNIQALKAMGVNTNIVVACVINAKRIIHYALYSVIFTMLYLVFGLQLLYGQWNVSPACWAFGGTQNDYAESAVELGKLLLVGGTTLSYGNGNEDSYVIALDNSGNPIWARAVGTDETERNILDGVSIGDTMAIFVGYTDALDDDAGFIFAIDLNGNMLWARSFYYNDAECDLRGVDYLVGDTFVWVVGTCSDLNVEDAIIVAKYSVNGNLLKSFGLYNSTYELIGEDIEVTDNGQLHISGTIQSFSNDDIVYIRVDTAGNVLTSVVVGGNRREIGKDLVVFPDDINPNSVFIVGATESFGAGARDGYIIRIDTGGNLLWAETYGNFNRDELVSIDRAPFKQLVAVGRVRGVGVGADDMFVLLIDSLGDTIWTAIIGGQNDDEANYVLTTGDGGFAVVGMTTSFGTAGAEVYVTKIANSGVVASDSCCLKVRRGTQIFADGNVTSISIDTIVGGISVSIGNVLPVDSTTKCGSESPPSWNVPTGCWTIGGAATDIGYSAEITSQGNFVVTGITNSYGNGQFDQYILSIDAAGNILWAATAGGPLDDGAYASEIVGTDTIVIGGFTSSAGAGGLDAYLTVWDGNGTFIKSYVLGESGDEVIYELAGKDNNLVYFTGYINSFGEGLNNVLFGYISIYDDNSYRLISIGTPANDIGLSITTDVLSSDFYIGGVRDAGGSDFLLMRVKDNGALVWANTWGTIADDTIYNVFVKPNGDVVVIGSSVNPATGNRSTYIAYIDPVDGSILQEAYIDKFDNIYLPRGILTSWDISVVSAVSRQTLQGIFDITKTNSDLLDTVWNRMYGDTLLYAKLNDIIETGDKGLVFVGSMPTPSEDIYLLKINAYGDITSTLQCCSQYPSTSSIVFPSLSVSAVSMGIDSGGVVDILGNASAGGGWICGNPLNLLLTFFKAELIEDGWVEISWGVSDESVVDNYVVYRQSPKGYKEPIYGKYVDVPNKQVSYTILDKPRETGLYRYELEVELSDGKTILSQEVAVLINYYFDSYMFYDAENNKLFVTVPPQFKGLLYFSSLEGKVVEIFEVINETPIPQTKVIDLSLHGMVIGTVFDVNKNKMYSEIILANQ